MPSYNPYQMTSYQNGSNPYGYTPSGYPAQSSIPASMPASGHMEEGMHWVDGEAAAKAFQMPPNWPANKPIPLWDINDRVIYFKSYNTMGMPNPLGKAHYILEEETSQELLPAQSGTSMMHDVSNYVTKDDQEHMMEYKNLKRVVCKELEKLDSAYEGKNEMSEADAKKYDMLMHGLKCQLTAEAMHNAVEEEDYEGASYARGRNPHTGRYMSRDAGYSGHYPPDWMYPPRPAYRMGPDDWRY